MKKYPSITDAAIAQLVRLQQPNGSFLSHSSVSPDPFIATAEYTTTFFTSCVLLALAPLCQRNKKIDALCERAVDFLIAEKGSHWTWNYWSRVSREALHTPYPDDLDDTALALAAIATLRPKALTGAGLASVTKVLMALEVTPGGPYTTWLMPTTAPAVWRDVDVAVNANIAFFLATQDVYLDGLYGFLTASLKKKQLESRYYPSAYPLYYFLSRVLKGDELTCISDEILKERNASGYWDNPLNTALASLALVASGYPPEKLEAAQEYLTKSFSAGAWVTYGFCLDPAKEGVRRHAGSEALTVALCLQAFTALNQVTDAPDTLAAARAQVMKAHEKRMAGIDKELQPAVNIVAQKILALDTKLPIVTLPEVMRTAVGASRNELSQQFLTNLGLASLYGWVAYTIIDDFLDGEGNMELLPGATWSLREMQQLFSEYFSDDKAYMKLLRYILDGIDTANAWEQRVAHYEAGKEGLILSTVRLPRYGRFAPLAARSLGHALPAVAVLKKLGYAADSSDTRLLLSFFKHFLIARQLNDDAHDWEEDLREGRLSSVATMLIQTYCTLHKKKIVEESWHTLIPALKELFWTEVVVGVVVEIDKHLDAAEKALKGCAAIRKPQEFQAMISRLRGATEKVRHERQRTLEFITTYQQEAIHVEA
jgi:hypothetical protein